LLEGTAGHIPQPLLDYVFVAPSPRKGTSIPFSVEGYTHAEAGIKGKINAYIPRGKRIYSYSILCDA